MRLIVWTAAVALAAAACGGKGKSGGTANGTGGGTAAPVDDGRAVLTRKVLLHWGTEAVANRTPPATKVWLGVTDETGALTSYPVGDVAGSCEPGEGGEMGALTTLRCAGGDRDANLIAVVRGQEVIVLRQWVDDGTGEPTDFEEQTRVTVPAGASVTYQP